MKQAIPIVNNSASSSDTQELYCRVRQLEEQNHELENERLDLQQNTETLVKSHSHLEEDIKRLREENDSLYGMVRLLKQQKFGRSSEKGPTTPELPMLPGLEEIFAQSQREHEALVAAQNNPKEEETETEVKGHKRKKSGRKPLPKNLPREEVIHDLAEDEKVCHCGCELRKIGEVRSEQLEYVPAVFKVLEHVRYKYGCKACEENIKLAPVPIQAIPKSMAAPGLLSYVMVAKFEDHLPLYRQSKIWKRHGVDLGRNTMSNWIIRCADLLSPLVTILKQDILTHDYAQADETTIQVLKEPGRKATTKSYIWAYKTHGKDKVSIVYEYHPTRAGKVPTKFLEGFAGYLQTDAYQGYNGLTALETIISVLCWAHARRKFNDIIKMTKGTCGKAQEAIKMIAELYAVEKEARLKRLPPDKIKELRHKKSKPILAKIKLWLDEHVHRAPPKGPLGGAIRYVLNHWEGLNRYQDDGRLSIDNNFCENKMRPFALGRKNWLFNDTVHGAKAAAIIYSLIETCKANNVNTFKYLNHVLREIPKQEDGADLTHLLPWNCKLEA